MATSRDAQTETRPQPAVILVLFADPDAGIQIAHWLSEAYHRTVTVSDGYDAAAILRQQRVTALITDRLLPPWPGLEPFPHLRKSHPDLAIVCFGSWEVDSGRLARSAGATHVLSCPLRRRAVLDALPRGAAAA